jgi:hypothetical protein
MDRVHGLWTGGALGPPWTGAGEAAGARQSAVSRALRLADGHREWPGRRREAKGCHFGPHRRAGGTGVGQR